jgi:hypothetical protein
MSTMKRKEDIKLPTCIYLIILWKAYSQIISWVSWLVSSFIKTLFVMVFINADFKMIKKQVARVLYHVSNMKKQKKGIAPQNWFLLLGYHPSACSNIHLWINSSGIHVTDMYLFQRDIVTKLSVSSDSSQEEALFHNQWMCNFTSMVIRNILPLLLYDFKKRAQELYLIYKSDQLGVYRILLYISVLRITFFKKSSTWGRNACIMKGLFIYFLYFILYRARSLPQSIARHQFKWFLAGVSIDIISLKKQGS